MLNGELIMSGAELLSQREHGIMRGTVLRRVGSIFEGIESNSKQKTNSGDSDPLIQITRGEGTCRFIRVLGEKQTRGGHHGIGVKMNDCCLSVDFRGRSVKPLE